MRGAGPLLGGLVAVGALPLAAQEAPRADLKRLPPSQHVRAVRYGQGQYEVSLEDGAIRRLRDDELSFKGRRR